MRQGIEASDRSVWKGLTAGMIGGLLGSWMMNRYQTAEAKVLCNWESNNPRNKSANRRQPAGGEDGREQNQDEDATVKTAEVLFEKLLHRKLSREEKKKAGPVVHYTYGALTGGMYGAAAEIVPEVKKGGGTIFAMTLFVGGDEIGTWKLGLAKSPMDYSISSHANALASHLVYGVTTELGRRAVRAIL
jgi:putative membrane protein